MVAAFWIHVPEFESYLRLLPACNPGWPMCLNFSIYKMGITIVPTSVQFSRSVVSDSLKPHEPQHTRPPYPSPTPGVHPNSCPLCWWCHPTISSSVIPFSSCPQSFPASESFQMSQLFTSGGQSIRVSASKLVLPMNTQNWSPSGWTGWISLQSKGLSSLLQHHSSNPNLPQVEPLLMLLFSCSVMSNSLWPHELYSPPGSSVLEIFQARILEWIAISFSRGYSQSRDETCDSYMAGRFFTTEPLGKPL